MVGLPIDEDIMMKHSFHYLTIEEEYPGTIYSDEQIFMDLINSEKNQQPFWKP